MTKLDMHNLLSFINSILDSDNFCRLLITFENSWNPDQDLQNVDPDLDANRLALW